jgi:tetratricopeptide (TPR) repeat protein
MEPDVESIVPPSDFQPLSESPQPVIGACQVCGRQDATLRFVVFPVVFSLIFVTYRRALAGQWCRRHARPRWLLASLVTSTLGWLGVPYGLLYTPAALIKLSAGGEQPPGENARLLEDLAVHKLNQRDAATARHCFEASLRFQDSPQVRDHLRQLKSREKAASGLAGMGFFYQFGLPALLLLAAVMLGFLVGITDYFLTYFTSTLIGEESTFFEAILSWAPLVAASFLVVLFLSRWMERVLAAIRCVRLPLPIAFAWTLALFLVYFVFTGRSTGQYLQLLSSYNAFPDWLDIHVTTAAVLTRGGLLEIFYSIRDYGISGLIYVGIMLVLCIFSIFAFQLTAVRTTTWQQRIVNLDENTAFNSPSSLPAWLGITVVPLMVFALAGAVPQRSLVDFLQAARFNSIGIEHWQNGQSELAIAELQKAIVLQPDNTEVLINLGWAHLFADDSEAALDQFSQARQLGSNSVDLYAGFGSCYFTQGDLQAAIEEYKRAVAIDPMVLSYQLDLAWMYYWAGDYALAEETYQQVLEMDAQNAFAYQGLGEIYFAQIDYEASQQAFEKALQINPQLSRAHLGLGQVLFFGGDLDAATIELEKARQYDPQDHLSALLLGMSYAHQGQWDKAVKNLEIIASAEPNLSAPHALLAGIYYQIDQFELMEQEWQLALQAPPRAGFDWYILASVVMRQNQFSEAETYLRNALEMEPQEITYQLYLADAFKVQGKYDDALEICSQVLAADQENIEALLTRSGVYNLMQEFDLAMQDLKQVEALDPDNWELHERLSFIYFHTGNLEQALHQAKDAVSLDKYQSNAYTSLASALLETGDILAAQDAAAQAIQLAPKDDIPYYVLGMSHYLTGNLQEAASGFEKFLELYWDRPYARQYRAEVERVLEDLR